MLDKELRALISLFALSKTRPRSLTFFLDFRSWAAANIGSDASVVAGSGVRNITVAAAVILSPPSRRSLASCLSSLFVFFKSSSFFILLLSIKSLEYKERNRESSLSREKLLLDKLEILCRNLTIFGDVKIRGGKGQFYSNV